MSHLFIYFSFLAVSILRVYGVLSLWGGWDLHSAVHVKSDIKSFVMDEKGELEREAETHLSPLKPPTCLSEEVPAGWSCFPFCTYETSYWWHHFWEITPVLSSSYFLILISQSMWSLSERIWRLEPQNAVRSSQTFLL